ncbi:MAG: molecular chaperone TorD family protein [Candidatus Mariimomonas ferrooxydans]
MGENKKLKDMAETAKQRSNIYSFLATIFHKELTPALLRQIKDPKFLGVLSEQGVRLGNDILQKPDNELIEDLAVEYTKLFLGPGKHISPHESVHHERNDGDWGMLWGKDTVLVKKFIESAGLEYKTDYKGLPDSIGVELEFMQQVTKRETQAWDEDDYDGALYCLKIEQKFIDEHLAKWIPIFCDKVISKAELSLYREMAKLTKGFIELEEKEINNHLSEAQKIKPH